MKSLNMYNCGLGRISWNDDVIDVLGLDSRLEANLVKLAKVKVKSKLTHLSKRDDPVTYCLQYEPIRDHVAIHPLHVRFALEPPAAQYGFPAAQMATSEPPAAQLALQPPGWAGADVF
ncbi:hypothetical protein Tco_0621145 [Tanacetum coccineum]